VFNSLETFFTPSLFPPLMLICRECYEEAVQRERTSTPLPPGLIDVDRLERVSVEMGRCSVCGLEKAVWGDKESGVNASRFFKKEHLSKWRQL